MGLTANHITSQKLKENKGMCHTMALPFTIKKYLKAKEEL